MSKADPEPTSTLKLLATYQGMGSNRTTRDDANGSKRVDGIAILVESRPFNPSNTWGFVLDGLTSITSPSR
jgi:hypothetical protein